MTAEAKLAKLGIRSRFDLVLHLPMRYEDETVLTAPRDAPPGKPVLVQAEVLRAEVVYRPKRQLIVHAKSGDEALALRFFNFYGSQLKQLQRAADEHRSVRAFGEVRTGWFGAEMAHPRYRVLSDDEPLAQSLTPVYPTTAGLTQQALRKLVLEALEAADLEDTLPRGLRRTYGLQDFGESVRLLHLPPPGTDLEALTGRTHAAWQRMKFDELLAQQLSMRMASGFFLYLDF